MRNIAKKSGDSRRKDVLIKERVKYRFDKAIVG